MVLGLCLFCMTSAQAQRLPDPNQPQDSGVQMILTHLSVTDQNFEMGWTIVNNTDHDVWICDSATDWFMDTDNETLVIRRRYNISNTRVIWEIPPFPRFRYSRLRPGEQKVKSVARPVPVETDARFDYPLVSADHAKRVAVEIGYYDEDLRALILEIVNVAEKLGCDGSAISGSVPQSTEEVYNRFFGGVRIARLFNSAKDFRDSVTSGGDEIIAPYFHQALHGEQVLRLEVDNVSIPFGTKYYPPLVAAEAPTGVTMTLTKLDVNDTNLTLGWKITNNTDHDVWVCDDVLSITDGPDSEVYLSENEQSLLIRRRLDVPTIVQWLACPYGRYVLLRAGQERNESLVRAVPVGPQRLFASGQATSDHARRLVVEIGFYNEDLPRTIRGVLEIAEKLNCTRLQYGDYVTPLFIRYFEGIWMAHWLFSDFEKYVYKDGDQDMDIPYTWQQFSGEQVFGIEIDGVHIPYDEARRPSPSGDNIPPPKGRACFLAETPVWIDGMIVPISKAVAGQAVRRSLCATPGPSAGRVEKVQEHTGTFECRDILLESGNHIGVVGNHCFMLDSGRWIAAQDLMSGQRLRTRTGTIAIRSVTTRAEPYTGQVYNLKVKNTKMYLVGEDAVIVRDY